MQQFKQLKICIIALLFLLSVCTLVSLTGNAVTAFLNAKIISSVVITDKKNITNRFFTQIL